MDLPVWGGNQGSTSRTGAVAVSAVPVSRPDSKTRDRSGNAGNWSETPETARFPVPGLHREITSRREVKPCSRFEKQRRGGQGPRTVDGQGQSLDPRAACLCLACAWQPSAYAGSCCCRGCCAEAAGACSGSALAHGPRDPPPPGPAPACWQLVNTEYYAGKDSRGTI